MPPTALSHPWLPHSPQGSSWDRSRRRFFIHNSAPPEMEGELPAPAGWMLCFRLPCRVTLAAQTILFAAPLTSFPCLCRCHAAVVRPTDVETFRAQLEAAGCNVEGALAAAAAQQQGAEAARQAANGLRGSPGSSPAKSSGDSAESESREGSSGRRLASGRSSAASVPATNWAALGASYMSSGGTPAFEVAPAGSLGALAHARRSGGSGGGNGAPAVATVEDEEAESAGSAARRGAAVPDFAVYVGDTQELHRVSWDHGVTVRVKGEWARHCVGVG